MKQEMACDDNFLLVLTAEITKAQVAFLQIQENARIGDIVHMLKNQTPT